MKFGPSCFNAARGYSLSPPPPLRGPPPPLAQGRLFVYGMPASLPDARDAGCCIVPSQREGLRYFSFPHRYGGSGERSEPIGAPMPHAALWVVQPEHIASAIRALVVSMPHAALWVVQLGRYKCPMTILESFNAARGFVGGATERMVLHEIYC